MPVHLNLIPWILNPGPLAKILNSQSMLYSSFHFLAAVELFEASRATVRLPHLSVQHLQARPSSIGIYRDIGFTNRA